MHLYDLDEAQQMQGLVKEKRTCTKQAPGKIHNYVS